MVGEPGRWISIVSAVGPWMMDRTAVGRLPQIVANKAGKWNYRPAFVMDTGHRLPCG